MTQTSSTPADNVSPSWIDWGYIIVEGKRCDLWYDGIRIFATDHITGREVARNATSLITLALKHKKFKAACWAMDFALRAGWVSGDHPYIFSLESDEDREKMKKIIQ